jgi:hypothetical protein
MPGRVSEAMVDRAARGRRSVRALLVSALLAAFTTLLSAGVASADFWPHDQQGPPPAATTFP